MRKLRICVYGGTNLPPAAAKFIRRLTCSILERLDVVIVTGGFLCFRDHRKRVSTDRAALRGARDYARRSGNNLRECFEAWLPAPHLDRVTEKGGVVRMSARQHNVRVRRMGQRSALRRRLALVRGVDLIITVAGRRHTEIVLEEALETDTPALPLAFAHGDSKTFWKANKSQIVRWFSLHEEDVRTLDQLTLKELAEQTDHALETILGAVSRARIGKCLVLLPFDSRHDKLFDEVIEGAVESVMLPDRLDYTPGSDVIRKNFFDAIEECRALIADVTEANPNVMYEIGYAHGKGITPLLFSRTADPDSLELPVYLRDLKIETVDLDSELENAIREYLTSTKVREAQGTTPPAGERPGAGHGFRA